MRQVTRKGLITVAAAGGMLATLSGGTAFADSSADGVAGNGSGVLTGNNIQAPANVPVNFCGNTVSVLGSLNSASGNCAKSAPTQTSGTAGDSDGIGSGNNIQAPVQVPVDMCGNTVAVLGDGNEATSDCGGEEVAPPVEEEPEIPGPENPGPDVPGPDEPGPDEPAPDNPGPDNPGDDGPGSGDSGGGNDVTPASDVRAQSEPVAGELAHTGAGDMIGIGAPLSAGLLIGGFVLYRRASRLARR